MGRLWILSVSWGLRSRPAQRFLTFRRSLGFRCQGSRSTTFVKFQTHDRKPHSSTVTKVWGQGPAQKREAFKIYKIVGPSQVRWLKLRPMSLVSCLSVLALPWRSRQMCSTKKKNEVPEVLGHMHMPSISTAATIPCVAMPQKLAADFWKVVDVAQVWSGRFGHIHGPGPCPNSPCLRGISTKPLETHDSCSAILVD